MEKIFGEMLGFLALAWPVLVMLFIVIGLIVVLWQARRWAAARQRSKRKMMFIAGIAFLLIFTWDVILGRTYFYYLCATEGGVKVYKQVKLPAEYWNEDGTLIETSEPSNRYQKYKGSDSLVSVLMPKNLSNSYLILVNTNRYSNDRDKLSKLFGVSKKIWKVSDEELTDILGTYTYFNYSGGWFLRSISIAHTAGTSCRKPENFSRDFFTKIFYRN